MMETLPSPGAGGPAGDPGSSGAGGRIVRGFGANIGGIGVTLAIQLISVPVLLGAWGVPMYGQWLVLSAIPTYLALSDLSFSSVAGNSMVMLVGQGRRAEAIELGRHLWSIVTVLTGMAVVAAVGIALIFGGALGSQGSIPSGEARVILAALFIQAAVGDQYGVLDAWYRAAGRYPLGTALRQLGRLLEFGALVVAVMLGARPGAAAVALLVATVAGFAGSFLVLRRVVPWSTFRLERPHAGTFRQLFSPGIAFLAFPLGSALSLQGFTIVISAALGASAVVVFATTRTVTRVALQAMGSINNSIWPELSRSIGGEHLDEARSIVRRSFQLAVAGSLCVVVGVGLFGIPIIRWWTHGLVDSPVSLLYLLLLVMVAHSIWQTLSLVLASTNRHRKLAVVYLAGTSVALLVAVPLSLTFGLAGAAVALFAIDIAMVAFVLPAALRVIDDRPGPFFRSVLDVRGAVQAALSLMRQPA